MFDPDPLRGDKYVLQARANRGILFTTSGFGPDSYDFAKVKTRWRLEDEDGDILDQENTYWSDGDNFTYIAERWELLECSCVNVAADPGTGIRNEPNTSGNTIEDIRARMWARQRMTERMSNFIS